MRDPRRTGQCQREQYEPGYGSQGNLGGRVGVGRVRPGEEFLAICPDADLEVAQTLGDRLRRAVADLFIDAPEFRGSVTISVGAAGYHDGIDTPARLLKLADEALYAAKDAGRNKVCIVDPAAVAV